MRKTIYSATRREIPQVYDMEDLAEYAVKELNDRLPSIYSVIDYAVDNRNRKFTVVIDQDGGRVYRRAYYNDMNPQQSLNMWIAQVVSQFRADDGGYPGEEY